MDLPAEPQIRWILRTTAALLQLGAEPVSGLVLPDAEFFPDRFDGSPASVAALMKRVQGHAGLGDLRVELGIVMPEADALSGGSCSTGGCGGAGKIEAKLDRVSRVDDGVYAVKVGAGEIGDAAVLTTALVRATSFMFMVEVGAYDDIVPGDREAATDLAGVLLGFGVLAANGSYIYKKGCGGVQVHSATRMPVDEVTLALAVFCKLHDVPERLASKHLSLTPREHFDEAAAWASSNMAAVRLLRRDPEAVIGDEFALSEARSWLARVLKIGGRSARRSPSDEIEELERELARSRALPSGKATGGGTRSDASGSPKDAARAAKLAEIRNLVEESLKP